MRLDVSIKSQDGDCPTKLCMHSTFCTRTMCLCHQPENLCNVVVFMNPSALEARHALGPQASRLRVLAHLSSAGAIQEAYEVIQTIPFTLL